jgi:hypothetical protein
MEVPAATSDHSFRSQLQITLQWDSLWAHRSRHDSADIHEEMNGLT